MTFSFQKKLRLRNTRQYQQVMKNSHESVGKYLVLYTSLDSKKKLPQLGIIASRYFGKAYARNRFKRISREAFRLSRGNLPNGMKIVVKPRKYALYASMQEVLEELLFLTKKYTQN